MIKLMKINDGNNCKVLHMEKDCLERPKELPNMHIPYDVHIVQCAHEAINLI